MGVATGEGRVGNRLLAGLAAADLQALLAQAERVKLTRGAVLDPTGARIDHVYFPSSGIVSLFAVTPHGRKLEVGLFGCEGMSGLSLLLGADRTPHETFVQVAGEALRIAGEALLTASRARAGLRDRLLRYVQAFTVQSAHTALSHGIDVIDARLARWLLMCHDRIEGDVAPVTHELLSTALGVRRSGITHAMHNLEGDGLVRALRGSVEIRHRQGLERLAGDAYGVPEAEFRRLLG